MILIFTIDPLPGHAEPILHEYPTEEIRDMHGDLMSIVFPASWIDGLLVSGNAEKQQLKFDAVIISGKWRYI